MFSNINAVRAKFKGIPNSYMHKANNPICPIKICVVAS